MRNQGQNVLNKVVGRIDVGWIRHVPREQNDFGTVFSNRHRDCWRKRIEVHAIGNQVDAVLLTLNQESVVLRNDGARIEVSNTRDS